MVTLVGILYFFLAILAIFAAIGLFLLETWDWGAITLVLGVIYLLIAFGCFKGWGLVWGLAIIFGIVNIGLNLYNMYMDDFAEWLAPVISILISLLVLWYLFTPKVKRWFRV
ncbi:MAG TPA: hypothetical protein VMW26_00060 [Methanomassiliicoccales archaeon]|nr:hypothetical protein [Methanomassiliicoccales archaeon]